MSNEYISNSDIYRVNAERDVSVILSRFNTQYIYDCIDNAIYLKNNAQFITTNPNLVRSLEDNFIVMKQQFPDDIDNIVECRDETYNEIIQYLCSKFNLRFNNNDDIDLYSAAYYLYEFTVSNYLQNITLFFGKFILKERNSLYKELNLEQFKKTTNINYNKKFFTDHIGPAILLNAGYIIDQLTAFDFDFETLVNTIYDSNNTAAFINYAFEDVGYFYNFFKQDIVNPAIRPNIITSIRLIIQGELVDRQITIDNTIKKETE